MRRDGRVDIHEQAGEDVLPLTTTDPFHGRQVAEEALQKHRKRVGRGLARLPRSEPILPTADLVLVIATDKGSRVVAHRHVQQRTTQDGRRLGANIQGIQRPHRLVTIAPQNRPEQMTK